MLEGIGEMPPEARDGAAKIARTSEDRERAIASSREQDGQSLVREGGRGSGMDLGV